MFTSDDLEKANSAAKYLIYNNIYFQPLPLFSFLSPALNFGGCHPPKTVNPRNLTFSYENRGGKVEILNNNRLLPQFSSRCCFFEQHEAENCLVEACALGTARACCCLMLLQVSDGGLLGQL